MSLIHQREMTEENLAAHRANGAQSQGAVTPEGKANSAAANLRHGFYCQAPNGALTAWGEDPEDYAGLMSSLMLFRVRTGRLSLRDVKNEDRTGYVHENKCDIDKMSSEKHVIYQENAPIDASLTGIEQADCTKMHNLCGNWNEGGRRGGERGEPGVRDFQPLQVARQDSRPGRKVGQRRRAIAKRKGSDE